MRSIAALPDLAPYATDLARVFGSSKTFAAPVDERGVELLRTHLEAVLCEVRPLADGPSLGEALRAVIDETARGQAGMARATKLLAELQALFVQAAFRRTKRAERGRLFAQLVVVFGLEPALEMAPERGDTDGEAHLRRVRRALRAT